MSIKIRNVGLRGSSGGSGGGGSDLTIGVDDNTLGNVISDKVTKIIWNTDSFGFTATESPDESGVIIIGAPAVFSPSFPDGITAEATTTVRVSESDGGTFVTDGWENTNQDATDVGTLVYSSSLITGFGASATLNVSVNQESLPLETNTFSVSSSGAETVGSITVALSNYAPDGDGSVDAANLDVTIDIDTVLSGLSGRLEIILEFTTHDGNVLSFTEDLFYDKNISTPSIDGSVTLTESLTPVIKYLSGIGYYTTGSEFTIAVDDISGHNRDSSRTNNSLIIDSTDYGIDQFMSSPWVDSLDWSNVSNLDSASGLGYTITSSVDSINHRWVGEATVGSKVRDSWGTSSEVLTVSQYIAVDTYVDTSTNTTESFDGEDNRLDNDYITSWTSNTVLVDGEAAVYGGSLVHPADIYTIEDTLGLSGSASDLSLYEPNEFTQPDYSSFVSDRCVYFREFLTPTASDYAGVEVNILCSGDIEALLQSEDVRIFMWKLGSSDPTSVNLTLPATFNPADITSSLENSLWLHGAVDYDFGEFDDGLTQSNSGATCRSRMVGTIADCTFGGFNVNTGVLMRIEVPQGVSISEITTTFN